MDQPTVSVLLPVYNERPKFLEQAITSILSQSYLNLELVILDDGSDQEVTVSLLEAYERRDPRIRLHRGPNRGLTRVLNLGLEKCHGKFVCRQDSDDWSEPTRIEKQIQFLRQNRSIGMVGSNIMLHQEDGTPLWASDLPIDLKDIMGAFPRMNPFCHGAVCFRRRAAEAIGGYREALDVSEDYDLFWRLCDHFGGANLPDILYHHRFTPRSISAIKYLTQTRAYMMTQWLGQMRHSGLAEDFASVAKEVDSWMSDEGVHYLALLKHADHLLLAGHYRGALRAYARGVITRPFGPEGYLKLLRLAAFVAIPPVRKWLFSGLFSLDLEGCSSHWRTAI